MKSDYLTMESEEVRELLAMIDRAEETLQLADKNYLLRSGRRTT